jgi:hypothetical protein
VLSSFHGNGGNVIAVPGPRWRFHYYFTCRGSTSRRL